MLQTYFIFISILFRVILEKNNVVKLNMKQPQDIKNPRLVFPVLMVFLSFFHTELNQNDVGLKRGF